ncbi:hypothetical protein NW762_013718 [Fusarium torreyae]|uniref:BTB domain-containing protein n=1 Tax=Fusarium torreyae TaxID=1237075 RepID=A0A9W8RLI2_9HYPO|nr:hypothetical protein NW762_013718 [Fusarium torreyae]
MSKIINVNGFDLPTVQYMISFLYTGNYQLASKDKQESVSDDEQDYDEADTVSHSSTALPETTEDENVESLLSHIRVNAIADYYNIQDLSQLANSKIQIVLDEGQSADVFPRILQEVSTSNRDANLRSIIASATAKCIEELTESETFRAVKFDHTLSIEILRVCGKRIQKLQHELNTVQREAAACRSSQARELHAKTALIKQANDSLDTLKQTSQCRHCSRDFNCYFEKESMEDDSSYVLRCRACRCRHSPRNI